MRSLKSTGSTVVAVTSGGSESSSPSSASARAGMMGMQRSPWHSPVPYLFGGLAAMLGLIAFALLILACSYWKLSGQMSGNDFESGDDEKRRGDGKGKERVVYEEQFVVILAGDDEPSCLATPVTRRVKCFVTHSDGCGDRKGNEENGKGELLEKSDEESNTTSSEQSQLQSDEFQLHKAETSSS